MCSETSLALSHWPSQGRQLKLRLHHSMDLERQGDQDSLTEL